MSFFGQDTYSNYWGSDHHTSGSYGGWYRTKRDHFVHSRGEKELADYFADHHEYYKYNKPKRFGGVKLKPDFYLPNHGRKGVYVEYQGMSGTSFGRRRYRAKQKIYDKNHVPVINLYPSQRGRLGQILMSNIGKFFDF